MAVSANQRLRKAAAKAAKRKADVAAKLERDRRDLAISKPRHVDLAACPIVDCQISKDFEKRGFATLTLARKMSLGRYGCCYFLLDLWCLGVKDAFFRVLDAEDYEEYKEDLEEGLSTVPIDLGVARKLLRDSAAYGTQNGFPPLPEYAEMERFFGDVAPADTTFTFGVEGKPYYAIGPGDPPARVRRIMETLEFTLGFDGFQYEYPVEDDEFEDDEGIIEGQLATDEEPPTRGGEEKS